MFDGMFRPHFEGMPDEELPYVFDRVYRARSADGARPLSVVTTFRVELPGFVSKPAEAPLPLPA
jgi:hypothetical protein